VKKVFPILMAFIIFVLPFGGLKVFAYNNGYFDSNPKPSGVTSNTTNNLISNLYDNTVNTTTSFKGSNSEDTIATFSSPINITDLSVYHPGAVMTLKFYDVNNLLISTFAINTTNFPMNNSNYIKHAVNGVSKITIFNSASGAYSISEFDLKTDVMTSIQHTEISNLITTVNNNNVTLTYDFPSSNADFTGSKIYRDGSLISTQNNLSGSFVDSGLSYDSSYSYKVTALYSDGFETSGVIDSVVIGSLPTDPSAIPPSNVTSLMVSDLTGSGATLNWSNSTDTDLASVNIYLNGLVVANVPLTSSYVLTGLTASTQYNYGVALVDNDGNVSSIVSTVFTTLEATDDIAPGQVKGVSADAGNSALYVKWSANTDSDLSGYNVYIDGVKFNTSVIKNTFLTVTDLVNDQSYDVQVSAVDLSGNEGVKSSVSSGIPLASKLPLISMDYTLSDVADAVSSWFASQWLILAFAISIPLSFYIASRVKLLFLD
jgi:hypothetical protein